MQVVTASGQVLSQITIEELSRKAGAPSLCVHRADLLRTFAEAPELSVIRTNATCVGFEQHSDVVTARFADGQSESGDLLLGADGIQSAIRAQLFGPSEPRYAGYTCWQLCLSSSAKGRSGKSWKKGKAYSQTPEARLRQPEPHRGTAPALTPSQSNRFVKKPSHSL